MSALLSNFTFDEDPILSSSPGLSEEANLLTTNLNEFVRDFESAESLNAPAVRELEDAFLDARSDGWDGYGALGVKDEVFARSRELLSQALCYFPAPAVYASPAGGIMLEWFVSPKRRFLISVGPEPRVSYAGLFGSNPVHGTAPDSGTLPREIVESLRRLYFL